SKGYDEGIKEGKERLKYSIDSKADQIKTLKNTIKEFEKSSGVDIDDWRHKPEKIGDAVRVVLNGSYIKELEGLEGLLRHANNCVESIEKEIQKHKDLKG
ncbi:unnamed protein product, partial [marine sediment metagenome]